MRRWVVAAIAGASGLLAASGCNAILGIEDRPAKPNGTGAIGGDGSGASGAAGPGGAGQGGSAGGVADCLPDCDEGCFENVCGGHRVVAMAPGDQVACALLQSGSVWCWGNDRYGAVGDGEGSSDSCLTKAGGAMVPCVLPSQRVDLPGPAQQVSTGWHTACAVLTSGDLYCWGINRDGELGHPPMTDGDVECEPGSPCRTSPTLVAIGGVDDVREVQLGTSFACAVVSSVRGADESVTCWGRNVSGQAGIGSPSIEIVEPGTTVAGIQAGGLAVSLSGEPHVCVGRTTVTPELACWGGNQQGALGVVSTTDCGGGVLCEASPVEPEQGTVALSTNFVTAPGRRTTCVVTDEVEGNVRCAGFDGLGMLGTPPSPWPPSPHPTFSPVPFFDQMSVVSLTGNNLHYCALASGGAVYCWGVNQFGQLGSGTVGDGESGACGDFGATFPCYATPQSADGLRDIEGIRASGSVTMALKDGQVYAWGVNQSGQLGHDPGTEGDVLCVSETGDSLYCNPTPALVANLPGPDPR